MSPTTIRRLEVYLVYPVVGAILALRGSEGFWRKATGYFGTLSPLRVALGTSLVYIISAFIIWWAIRWFRPRPAHFANMAKFPPALASVVLGYGLWEILFTIELRPHEWEWAALNAPLLLMLVLVARASTVPDDDVEPQAADTATSNRSRPLADWTTTELLRWLKRLEPIRLPNEDLLAATTKATRVAEVITTPRDESDGDEHRRTVAVRGSFGVGKSSLILLAEAQIRRTHGAQYIFVPTNCWGFESSARAQEHVLEACVAALSRHIDCNMLRRVPAHYGDALQKTEGWMKPLLVFAFGEANPLTQLKRFVGPLRALDAYLVAVIEDADRNGAGFDTGQIMAMLHHMREVPRLAFIVSASKDSPIELFKVADEVVFIDSLPWDTAVAMADKIRAFALGRADFIDPESLRGEQESRRPKTLVGDASASFLASVLFSNTTPSWGRDLGSVLSAMRILKGALRDFLAKWDRLWGEVDPDDLLVSCALRHAAPRIYEFIQRHALELQVLPAMETAENPGDERTALVGKLRARWMQACEGAELHVDAAAGLAAELFPAVAEIAQVASISRSRLQSVSRNGARYFTRLHLGLVDPAEVSERKMIKLLADLRSGAPGATDRIAEAFLADDRLAAELVEAEGILLSLTAEQKLAVVTLLLANQRRTNGPNASASQDGLGRVTDWLPKMGGVAQDSLAWYQSEMEASVPDHMRLAAQLVHVASEQPGIRDEVPAMLLQVLTNRIATVSGDAFVRKFLPQDYTSLRFLLKPIALNANGPAIPPWLYDLVLDAMRVAPETMTLAGAFAFAAVDSLGELTPEQALHAPSISRFFGPRQRDFYTLVAQHQSQQTSPRITYLETARQLAQQRLAALPADAPAGTTN